MSLFFFVNPQKIVKFVSSEARDFCFIVRG